MITPNRPRTVLRISKERKDIGDDNSYRVAFSHSGLVNFPPFILPRQHIEIILHLLYRSVKAHHFPYRELKQRQSFQLFVVMKFRNRVVHQYVARKKQFIEERQPDIVFPGAQTNAFHSRLKLIRFLYFVTCRNEGAYPFLFAFNCSYFGFMGTRRTMRNPLMAFHSPGAAKTTNSGCMTVAVEV